MNHHDGWLLVAMKYNTKVIVQSLDGAVSQDFYVTRIQPDEVNGMLTVTLHMQSAGAPRVKTTKLKKPRVNDALQKIRDINKRYDAMWTGKRAKAKVKK